MGERRGGDRQAGRGRKGERAKMGDVRLERPDPLGLTRLMVFCVSSKRTVRYNIGDIGSLCKCRATGGPI